MIPPNKANHASFIELLPTGDLLIAWFSGTKEGQNDVSIYIARLASGSDQWSNASLVSRRDGYSNQNPVLYYDSSTKILNLWHSQQPADKGETDANVWHLQSTDGKGINWTKPVDLLTKPGSFDRNRIIPSLDGGLIFPIYYSGNEAFLLVHDSIIRLKSACDTNYECIIFTDLYLMAFQFMEMRISTVQ